MTAGGRSLPDEAERYVGRLLEQQVRPDPPSRRHHYVPKAYLRPWSPDRRRIWTLDAVTGDLRLLGLADVCVAGDFYRVLGPDGIAHNRVELLFGVVDQELARVQRLFTSLTDPESLTFDDLLGLGVSMAVQRMRTAQSRRLQLQLGAWMVAQNPSENDSLEGGPQDPYRMAGLHTQLTFSAMWEAADVLTTRQIEIWDDPKGRFLTCDAPVLVPFRADSTRPALYEARHIIWPLSPSRAVVLSEDHTGDKAVIRRASGKAAGLVRRCVVQGRERMIFGSEEQLEILRRSFQFTGRAQARLRCSDRTPDGEFVPPPGCCVEHGECYADRPDVALCEQGLHSPAPAMEGYR